MFTSTLVVATAVQLLIISSATTELAVKLIWHYKFLERQDKPIHYANLAYIGVIFFLFSCQKQIVKFYHPGCSQCLSSL